jgi:hypothetical protein
LLWKKISDQHIGVFNGSSLPRAMRIAGIHLHICFFKKDILSGRVLTALSSSIPVPVSVKMKGFEETLNEKNCKEDSIISNIPFGNFRVFDKVINAQLLFWKEFR